MRKFRVKHFLWRYNFNLKRNGAKSGNYKMPTQCALITDIEVFKNEDILCPIFKEWGKPVKKETTMTLCLVNEKLKILYKEDNLIDSTWYPHQIYEKVISVNEGLRLKKELEK